MSESILDSTKKLLGFDSDYTAFDLDIITHINSVFFSLQQLGVGPKAGFFIEDNETEWSEYTGGVSINAVRSYMFLKVRMLFDPPATSFAIAATEKQISELEWRLNVQAETTP